MLNFVDAKFKHLLEGFDQRWLTRDKLFEFSNVSMFWFYIKSLAKNLVQSPLLFQGVDQAGSFVTHIWGFIDGTARPICRPIREQKQYYSGHKRIHCLKYLAIMCPNGIIARLNGPYIGRRHDSFILDLSGLILDIEKNEKFKRGNGIFHLYGDTGYVNTKYILTNFRNPRPQSLESEFNKRMARIRVVVEWGFGKVLSLFSFVDYKKNQKILLQPVGKQYRVATILTNCHVCLNNGQVGEYFSIMPPTLEEYLR